MRGSSQQNVSCRMTTQQAQLICISIVGEKLGMEILASFDLVLKI